MSNIKCPICNVPLDECGDLLCCPNDRCAWVGNKELWQAFIDSRKEHDLCRDVLVERTKELDRTRKILETAVSALKYIQDGNLGFSPAMDFAEKALEQITVLKQKE